MPRAAARRSLALPSQIVQTVQTERLQNARVRAARCGGVASETMHRDNRRGHAHPIQTKQRRFADDSAIGCHYACSHVSLQTPVMPLNREPKYPNRRAYVLKLRSDAKSDALAGRLENLVTGQQREFTSSRELLDSIASDLQASTDEPSGDATGQ